jgi:CBS domain-containing protein
MAENPETKTSSETKEQARATASSTRAGAEKGAEALQQGARSVAETLQQSGEVGAQTAVHFGEAADATIRRGSASVASAQQELVQDVARQFEQTIVKWSEMLQNSSHQWRTFMQVPTAASGGMQDLQRSVSATVERVVQTNLQATQQLFRLNNTAGLVELQQRFTGEYLNALMEGTCNIVRTLQHSAEQTLRPLEQNGAYGHASGRVADVMAREVRVANPEDSVQQVAQIMREADTGALPVGEGDRLVGMVTDRDVAVRLVAEGRDPARTKVRDVMSQEVRYVFEDEELEHVADNMAEQQVRRLPVMNREKRLVGMLSLGDMAKRTHSHLTGKALRGIAREGGQHTGSWTSKGTPSSPEERNIPKDVPASDRDRQREIAARVGGTVPATERNRT